MDITVRSLPESEGGIHVVTFTRQRGDPFAFHRVFKRVQTKVADLQGCDAGWTSEVSKLRWGIEGGR